MTAPTPKDVFDDLRVCPETQQKCRRASVSYARSNGTGWACMDCEQPMGNEPPVSAVLTAYDALKGERDAAVRASAAWEREAVDGRAVLAHHREERDKARARLAACERVVAVVSGLVDSFTIVEDEVKEALRDYRTAVATAQGDAV